MKQTAVEWFHEQLLKGEFINDPDELLRQANELFEKQVIDFAEEFSMQHTYKGTAQDYYTKTYFK